MRHNIRPALAEEAAAAVERWCAAVGPPQPATTVPATPEKASLARPIFKQEKMCRLLGVGQWGWGPLPEFLNPVL